MLASFPASMVNQISADLGIPNRFRLNSSRSSSCPSRMPTSHSRLSKADLANIALRFLGWSNIAANNLRDETLDPILRARDGRGLAALTSTNAFAADPLPTESHTILTADLAVEAAQAAIGACKAQGYGVSVVVAGRDGMPKVVIVRDGPRGVGPEVARRKAYTAAMERVSTGDSTKRVSTDRLN
jgi:hypothetical protein